MCCVLSYMWQQNGEDSILRKPELDAFLATGNISTTNIFIIGYFKDFCFFVKLIRSLISFLTIALCPELRDAAYLTEMRLEMVTVRGVHLATMFIQVSNYGNFH